MHQTPLRGQPAVEHKTEMSCFMAVLPGAPPRARLHPAPETATPPEGVNSQDVIARSTRSDCQNKDVPFLLLPRGSPSLGCFRVPAGSMAPGGQGPVEKGARERVSETALPPATDSCGASVGPPPTTATDGHFFADARTIDRTRISRVALRVAPSSPLGSIGPVSV